MGEKIVVEKVTLERGAILLGVSELAHALSIGVSFARLLVGPGGPLREYSRRIGNRILVPRQAVERWVEHGCQGADTMAELREHTARR